MSPDLQQPINASTDAGSSSPLPSAPPRGAGEKGYPDLAVFQPSEPA